LDKKIVMSFAVLMITLSGVGIVYGVWSMSHTATGHVTVTASIPVGDFTVPASFDFPDTVQGTTSTLTVTVESTLNEAVTLTATGGIAPITVTSNTVTLPANGTADITLTVHVGDAATEGGHPIPVIFTVVKP
jgi:hypothetical protein